MPDKCDTLKDKLAMSAPAVDEDFIPTMTTTRPTAVQSPTELSADALFPETYKVIVDNFYDAESNTWDDGRYENVNNFNGQPIPSGLKNLIADQYTLYQAYLVADAAWLESYEKEKELQWPYYYAEQVLARRT